MSAIPGKSASLPAPRPAATSVNVLAAPWVSPLRARDAGRILAEAGAASWLAATSLAVATVVAAVLHLFWVVESEFGRRSPAQVWHAWSQAKGQHPLLVVCLITMVSLLPSGLGAALLFLTDVHRSGSVLRSYRRCVRAMTGGLVPAAALIWTGGMWALTDRRFGPPPTMWVLFTGAGLWGLVALLTALARGAAEPLSPPVAPLRCESCGYDLTHQADHGVCTECGDTLRHSLDQPMSRPGPAWEEAPAAASWMEACTAALFRPSAFHRRLPLRVGEESARRFAMWHYPLIGLGGCAWILASIGLKFGWADDLATLAAVLLVYPPLVAWALKRAVSSVAAVAWSWNRTVPDLRWLMKASHYETAYLWSFALFNGLFITTMIWTEGRLATSAGVRSALRVLFFGIDPGVGLWLVGTAALIGGWLWRYRLIARAIRWSNF